MSAIEWRAQYALAVSCFSTGDRERAMQIWTEIEPRVPAALKAELRRNVGDSDARAQARGSQERAVFAAHDGPKVSESTSKGSETKAATAKKRPVRPLLSADPADGVQGTVKPLQSAGVDSRQSDVLRELSMGADTHAARELQIYVDNDEPLYKAKMYVFRALARKKDRGRYDARLAPKAFLPLLTTAAKKYVREFGSSGDRWNTIFCPISRRHAALGLVDDRRKRARGMQLG